MSRHGPIVTPALDPSAVVASMRTRIEALGLDLSGLSVVTEAATGAYAVTAPIAAMAGARVTAFTRPTRHGTAAEAAAETLGLAEAAGVADRITVTETLDAAALAQCDILTNSGHLRPITAGTIALLPPRAVIGLMFEAWEFRGLDLDLAAARARGIRVAAVNERHPDVGVFDFLGPLAVRQLQDAGLDPDGRRVALLCDNPFLPHVHAGLEEAGAITAVAASADDLPAGPFDAVVVSLDPYRNRPLDAHALRTLARKAPRGVLTQFFGDIDRAAAVGTRLSPWPPHAPARGHMGILLNVLGPEPIIRLQAGGLRAAEVTLRADGAPDDLVAELL